MCREIGLKGHFNMIDYDSFIEQGYFIVNFENCQAISEISQVCERICKEQFEDRFTSLADYHKIDVDKAAHEKLQFGLFQEINAKKIHHKLVKDNLGFFVPLIGPDIDIQTECYLRIARPGQENDNIGLHRDTDYGNSAFEISISVPLIDQGEGTGLCVVPGSHKLDGYSTVQVSRTDVEKGSDKNKMGFLYAPKVPQNISQDDVKCISLRMGQGLGFTLGLIHGQGANSGVDTRWSIDFRFKNSFYPLSSNLKEQYYSNLMSSPVTRLASDYYAANRDEVSALTFDPLLKNK